MQPMQQMQPRVVQQAVLRQPVVLSHARPAQPWLGQVQQLGQFKPGPAGPMAMPVAMPVAMPAPIVKAMVKQVVRSQWVYAAPLQSTPGWSAHPKVVFPKPNLPKPQVVSVNVTSPQRKELPLIDGQVPKDVGVEGMHPMDFQRFWEQSFFTLLSTCLFVPVGFARMPWVPRDYLTLVCSSKVVVFSCDCAFFGFHLCVKVQE